MTQRGGYQAFNFLKELRDFYASCGRPPYPELTEISERLDELYPLPEDDKRGRDLPILSKSALSETLNGRRKRLPSAGWLTAFVLSCQRRALELGVIKQDPGLDSLPEWHQKLRMAQAASDPPGKDTPTAPASRRRAPRSRTAPPEGPSTASPRHRPEMPRPNEPSGETGAPPAAPPDATSGRDNDADGPPPTQSVLVRLGTAVAGAPKAVVTIAPVARAAVIKSAVPVHLPAPLRDYVAGYGPYGRQLLVKAQDRVIDAVHQVAVLLLAADSVHGSAEAQRLLIYAAAADHHDAINLLDAHPEGLDRLDAAGHACELADAAAADSHRAAAKVFYECAARGGLPTASVKLADTLLAEGKPRQALRWLSVAAHQGDTRAEIQLEALRLAGRVPPVHPASLPAAGPLNGWRPGATQ